VVLEAEAKATVFVLKVKDMPVYKLAVHHRHCQQVDRREPRPSTQLHYLHLHQSCYFSALSTGPRTSGRKTWGKILRSA